jgi:catechol 2,3-dioxygenase-like lactoylglutathione lyase family enzyme
LVAELDHLILKVNDAQASVQFYVRIMGFTREADDGPFSVVRVHEGLTLQLAPWGTKGGEHFAFALAPAAFDEVFTRVRESGIEYGDSFQSVGSQKGPGIETGARGPGKTVCFFDPDRHLIEIRHYER